jgi:hypothetical protein
MTHRDCHQRYNPITIALLLMLNLVLLLTICSCNNGTSSTLATSSTKSYKASQEDITASNKTITGAADSIRTKDVKTFTSLMSENVMKNVKGTPDLSSPEAVSLADSLKNAKIVGAQKDAFLYEITLNGSVISFMVVKENGTWKISGL